MPRRHLHGLSHPMPHAPCPMPHAAVLPIHGRAGDADDDAAFGVHSRRLPGCPLHMLRAREVPKPVTLVPGEMKIRQRVCRVSVSAKTRVHCEASLPRAALISGRPTFLSRASRKVIPGRLARFRGDDIDSSAPVACRPGTPWTELASRPRTVVGVGGDLAGDRADQGGGPAALRRAGPPPSRIRSVSSGRSRRRG